MRSPKSILLPPLLCLLLLAGIGAERMMRLTPPDAVPYHARVARAVNAMPTGIEIDGVRWSAAKVDVPTAAVRLLRPNALVNLHFTEIVSDRRGRAADLLVVQCGDSRDMTGHYPPICYPGNGYVPIMTERRPAMDMGGEQVPFTEYHFEKEFRGITSQVCVYNFFVVPGRGIVPDIGGVRDAAEDYQRMFFGAAQFQVLVSAELPRATREEILRSLIAANAPLLKVLKSAEIRKP